MLERLPAAVAGRVALPRRYCAPWRAPFEQPIVDRLASGSSILDVGSGRRPAIEPGQRPGGVRYVGLDIAAEELDAAAPEAYDEVVVADAMELVPDLIGEFDQVVSWQVLEHVRDLPAAVENMRRYLVPGGQFSAVFSGAWSAFGILNRMLPNWLGSQVVDRAMRRSENNAPVFPAHYDHCHASALGRQFAGWQSAEIEPLYRGATYFGFSPPIQRLYLTYENAIAARQVANLATHYRVRAIS